MRKHLPKASHRLRNEVAPEKKIPFEKRLDERLVPVIRFFVVGCEIGSRESTSGKVIRPVCTVKFGKKKRGQPLVADSTGQRFGALVDEVARSGSKDQKMSVAAPVVAKTSDDREQIASALYFVDTDEFFSVAGKEQFRIGQLCKVGRPFKVKRRMGTLPGLCLLGALLKNSASILSDEKRQGQCGSHSCWDAWCSKVS